MTAFIGIDPGISGAIAYVTDKGWASCEPFKRGTPKDWLTLLQWIRNANGDAFAMLERVHSMPRQGVASTFKFGHHAGMCEAFLIAAEIPFEFVTPLAWQKAMGCLSHGDKNVTKRRAEELFPTGVVITHATADALLIAEYCRRTRVK
jgi:crossover junction endodeoxyribonuclease RuvC